jgi:putative ABC transport system ATP-binding protein
MEHVIINGINLCKKYQMGEVTVEALKNANFQLFEKEFVVVLGPSGSGKSTLLNIIGGMDSPTSGELYFRDQSIHNANEKALTLYRRDAIGFIFQFYNLMPNLTAYENVKLSTEISKNPLDVDKVLKDIALWDRKNHFPSQLSGGQQQRIAIARAVAKNPDILLCDEPTGALDISTGIIVLELLLKFKMEYGKTVVIITHNAEIAKIADRVFFLKDGLIEKIVKNDVAVSPREVVW